MERFGRHTTKARTAPSREAIVGAIWSERAASDLNNTTTAPPHGRSVELFIHAMDNTSDRTKVRRSDVLFRSPTDRPSHNLSVAQFR